MNFLALAILLAIGLAIYAVVLVWATARSLTRPPRRSTAWALARSLPSDPGELPEPRAFTEWTFRSRGRELPVWDVVGDDAAGPVLVLTHGWADSRVVSLPRIAGLAPSASRVIAWDMPGHANAAGTCSLGLREVDDLLALVETIGETGRPLVLVGFSLGAGVSIEAGARCGSTGGTPAPRTNGPRIAAVIAEAPYRLAMTPARRVLASRNFPHTLNLPAAMALVGLRYGSRFGARFDRAEHAKRLGVPLLVIHGVNDAVSPVEDGREIAAAVGRFVEIPEAGHADIWIHPRTSERAAETVRTFCLGLREHGAV